MNLLITFFRILFLKNWGLKMSAIVMGVLVWIVIQEVTSFESNLAKVPVKIYTPEGVSVHSTAPSFFEVAFRGSREDMQALGLNEAVITIEIDLRNEPFKDQLMFAMDKADVNYPGAARVLHIRPKEIEIQLDRTTTKRVPVRLSLRDNLPEGYKLITTSLNPTIATLTGSEKQLQEIQELQAGPISLNEITNPQSLDIPIIKPNLTWSGTIDPPAVTARIEVERQIREKTFPAIPVSILTPAEVTSAPIGLMPQAVDITVQAGNIQLDKLNPLEIKPYIYYIEKEGAYDVRVIAPDFVKIINIDPPKLQVEYEQTD